MEAELDVDDDLSLLEISLFLVSVFFDSLFDSGEEGEEEVGFELLSLFDSEEEGFELLSLFDSDEAGDSEPLSLFDSPFVCPLRA